MSSKGFVKGAIVLIIFNLIGKIIGAVYRIPLANLLGSQGIGEYQLVFPLYSLLLSISTSGIPVAISKLVAEYNSKQEFNKSKHLLKLSFLYLFCISLICSFAVVILSKFISNIQGNSEIYICYYAISPAVLFVGLLSVFRGYFQGNLLMFPTAISSLIEQVFKLFFGMFFAVKFISKGIVYGVFGALLGITISELFALLFLFVFYLAYSSKHKQQLFSKLDKRFLSKQLVSTALPITLGGLAAPITAIIDSLLVVNLLRFSGFSNSSATSMLGLQSGIVEPILNIPIVIAVSISASLLPNLSKAFVEKKNEDVKTLIEKALQITLSVSLACSICFVVFGKQILEFLYSKSISNEEILIAIKLLFLGGANLVLLSLVQVSAGILQGIGKHNLTAKTILIGCGIKIVLTFALVSVKTFNIYGSMLSGAISYLVVFLINYKSIIKNTLARVSNILQNVLIQECFVCMFAFFSNMLFDMVFGGGIALFAGGIIAIIIFIVTYYVFFLTGSETKNIST